MAFSWDVEHTNLTISPFTLNGSPLVIDAQHTPNSTCALDGVNDWKSSTDKTVAVGDTHMTFGFWLYQDAQELSTKYFLANRAISPGTDNYFYLAIQTNGRVGCTYQGNGLFKASQSPVGDMDYAQWVHYIMSINMTTGDVNIYKAGVEVTYSSENTGTLTGVSMADRTLSVGSLYMDSYATGIVGRVSRVKIGAGTTTGSIITGAEALTEYNAEVASIGSGFSTDFTIIPKIIPSQLIPSSLIPSTLIPGRS